MASPLILLGPGIAIGFLPMVGSVAVEPQIVPEVILPPLLFGAAVAMPVMDVRRELPAVAGLAGGLVLVSAMVLGAIIHVMVPEVSPAWTIALGAVLGHRRGPHDLELSGLAQDCDVAPFEERLRHACDVDEEALAARSADRGRLV